MEQFRHLSSEVDWCEKNYTVLPFIAEFWNTISNVLFIVIPPVLMIKFQNYSHVMDMPINHVWALLMVVGLGSIYFHSTLSLVGQLVDEVAIVWVIMGAWSLFLPKSLIGYIYPKALDRKVLRTTMAWLTLLLTIVCCIKPELNHNALHLFAIPTLGYTVTKAKQTTNKVAKKLSYVSIMWFAIGFSSWVIDRHFCEYLSAFPYLHCFWHLFICIGAYLSIVCNAFYYAELEHPETDPEIKFWPMEDTKIMEFIGIPYVTVRAMSRNIKPKNI